MGLLYAPEPEGSGGGDPKKEEKKEEKKVESKAESEDILIPFKMPDGEIINLSGEQAIQAAQYGLIRMKEERNKKNENKKEPVIEDEVDEVVKLREEVAELRKERKHEKDVNEINTTLYQLADSHKETKENPRLAKKISELTLARVNINPQLNMSKVFKEELKDYLEMIPEPKSDKEKFNDLVRRSTMSTIRGGSAPIVESEEKFGAKDIRNGKSRKAMLAWVEKAQAENR